MDPEVILIVDARGLWCPEPMVMARRAWDTAAPGAIIEVWATDPLTALDLETLSVRIGADYLGAVDDANGSARIRIAKRSV
jgi:tRNA 2-thiouridine synthesizing protein A